MALLKEGWVERKSKGVFSGWAQKWLELKFLHNKSELRICADKHKTEIEKVLVLETGKTSTYVDTRLTGQKFKFSFTVTVKKETVNFAVNSFQERASWIAAIDNAASKNPKLTFSLWNKVDGKTFFFIFFSFFCFFVVFIFCVF